jgi:hypothetical protein
MKPRSASAQNGHRSAISEMRLEEDDMARYGKKAQETVEEALKKFKKGKLTSGKSGAAVKSKEQAIAIGLSEARKKGAKVPPQGSK